MKKRILASFLSLVLVLSLVPVSALAAEDVNSGDLPVLADESLPLTGYCGADSTMDSQTYDCTSGNNSFTGTYYSNAIWTITENGVLSSDSSKTAYKLTISGTGAIGDFDKSWSYGRPWHYALAEVANCEVTESKSRITEIEIADGITEIGAHTFEAYENISSIVLPDSVTKVGENAFNSCKKATSIDFGTGLKEIGAKAFSDCDALTSLSLPNGLEVIGASAFGGCGELTGNLVIPDSVTTIGDGAFTNDTKLTGKLTIGSSVTSIGKSAFGSCKFSGTLTIPDSVTSIGEAAFNTCKFTNISLGNGLVEIGKNAFYNSGTYSGHLSIPDSVTTIGESAFSSLGFESIHLGKSVKTIGESAFINCTNVHSLDIASVPSSIAYGKNAFHSMGTPNILYVNSESQKTEIDDYITSGRSITAITNGGTFAPDTKFTSDTLVTPTKEGYIFGGWYTKDGADGDWGNEVTTPEADQIYYAKWIELTAKDIKMEYGSTQTPPTIDGVALKDWTSDNEKVVQIVDGKLKAVGLGTANITANAALAPRSGETLTVSVTVTAKKIKVSMTDKTETYNEQPHTIEAEAAEGGTLPTDLELVYSYKESNASDDEYIHVAPSHPGTYTVKVESGNPNYTLDGTTTATLTISEPQQEQDVSDHVTVTAPSLVYDGKAKVYTAAYEGITDWTIAYYDTEGTKLDSAPVNAGDYWVTINGDGAGVYASITESFTITPATLTIKANNQSIRVGDQLPEYTYTVSGWQGNDTDDLLSGVTATCPTADANKAGDYTITVSGPAAIDNYTISYVDGTLTVSRRSSGGGGGGSSSSSTTTETERNPDGSTTTTVTDKKTGTVTETTKFKDGSTLVVETKKDGTVTTTETAKNGVKVKTVDEPGEDVTAKVTIPRSVGEAVVTIPADVDYGMVAVDAKTGEVVKLSVPTKDGMTVKLDGSAELVLVDRSRDFTDTKGHWAEDAIDFATAHELFAGTSDTTFTPNSPMTRAMLMTVLARFDGQDTTGGAVWYEKAMAWAQENGISDGSNPNGSITREQLATMLWRYAGSPIGDGSLSSFGDSASVNGYAVEAMRWAVGEGLISGTDAGLLAPQGNATRAQVATILMRFVESLTK